MARRWWQLAPAVAAVVVALTSCGSSSSSTTPTTSGGAFAANLNPLGTARQAGAGQGPPTFAALPSPLGTYLATGFKLAVYINLNDSSSRVTCTGSCANTWRPIPMSGLPQPAPGVNLPLFGKVTRPDGTTQATYGGYPLYTYMADKPLETKGLGVGGTWYLISNAGSPIR